MTLKITFKMCTIKINTSEIKTIKIKHSLKNVTFVVPYEDVLVYLHIRWS